jgi:hypothetical protein
MLVDWGGANVEIVNDDTAINLLNSVFFQVRKDTSQSQLPVTICCPVFQIPSVEQ